MPYSPKHAAPKPAPVRRRLAGVAVTSFAAVGGGAAMAQPASAAATVWDRVAACESGGNWSINTGNGYYGGLQFSYQTWKGFGGQRYAATANRATKAQQIEIAQKVLKTQGPGAWPVCSKRAGLTSANGGAASASSSAAPTVTSRAAARPGKLVVDGKKGPATRRAIERWVGGSVNGSHQRRRHPPLGEEGRRSRSTAPSAATTSANSSVSSAPASTGHGDRGRRLRCSDTSTRAERPST